MADESHLADFLWLEFSLIRSLSDRDGVFIFIVLPSYVPPDSLFMFPMRKRQVQTRRASSRWFFINALIEAQR